MCVIVCDWSRNETPYALKSLPRCYRVGMSSAWRFLHTQDRHGDCWHCSMHHATGMNSAKSLEMRMSRTCLANILIHWWQMKSFRWYCTGNSTLHICTFCCGIMISTPTPLWDDHSVNVMRWQETNFCSVVATQSNIQTILAYQHIDCHCAILAHCAVFSGRIVMLCRISTLSSAVPESSLYSL